MSAVIEKLLRNLVIKSLKSAAKDKVKRWAKSKGPDIQFKIRGREYDFYVTQPEAPKPHPKAKRIQRGLSVDGEKYAIWKRTKKR
jgi:hypothetical protein